MSVGRFAGAELGKFMGSGVKFGDMAVTERGMNSQMNAATSIADADVSGTELTTEADVEATKLISEAQAKLGAAQSQAQGVSNLASGIAGGIGGLGSMFGGGGSAASVTPTAPQPFTGSPSSFFNS